jgi:hypothetical protein
MLLGAFFILHSCSEDNNENSNIDATESVDVVSEGLMKLMVDGKFEKNMNSVNDIEDGAYAYVVIDSKNGNTIKAYTSEVLFKKDAQYHEFTSKMTKKAYVLPDFDMDQILAEENAARSRKIPAVVNSKAVHPPTDFDHVAEHPWADHDDLVAHFEYDGSSWDSHHSVELATDMNLYNGMYHYHYSDLTGVYTSPNNTRLKSLFQYSDHSIIQNPNFARSYVFLYSGTNRTGTQYFFAIDAHDYVDVPAREYNTISVYNY